MSFSDHINHSRCGSIDRTIASREIFIQRVVSFLYKSLPKWKNDPARPQIEDEPRLNATLCKALNEQADMYFKPIRFTNEDPQAESRRKPDLSLGPSSGQIIISGYKYSIYDPLFFIECKRLPTTKQKDREKEYVWGKVGESASGAIQRFKTGDHASEHDTAGIIAYIQENDFSFWENTVNGWIQDFISSPPSQCPWTTCDKLRRVEYNDECCYLASISCREKELPSIKLHHFWISCSDKKS